MRCPKCDTVYLEKSPMPPTCRACGHPNPVPLPTPPGRDFRETTPINDLGPEEAPLKERELRG